MSPDPTEPSVAQPPGDQSRPPAPTTPAPPTPVPLPPVAPHTGPALGIEPDQLKNISTTWRQEADAIEKLEWSALSAATGDGSDVLAAVRDIADPATQALRSIATRFTTMADLIEKYSANVIGKDQEIADEFGKLRPR